MSHFETVQDARAAGEVRRVMLVDDHVDSVDALQILLELEGYCVRVAYDAPAALRMVHDFPAEGFVIDLRLPGMSGHELACALRGLPAFAGATLIAVSGSVAPEDVREATRSGFDRHFGKPVELSRLVQALRQTYER